MPGIKLGFSAKRMGYASDIDIPRWDGQRYIDHWERMFAVGIQPQMVAITMFNKWHESTQIEPAQPDVTALNGYAYLDYKDLGPESYLRMTREWVDKFLGYEWPKLLCTRPLLTGGQVNECKMPRCNDKNFSVLFRSSLNY